MGRTSADRITTVADGTFKTVDELTLWLNHHGVDTSEWGKGKAKRVDNLKKEIELKETVLQLLGGKVFRTLTVCKVVVRRPGRMNEYLVCYGQRMEDGRERERNQIPSEKLFAGEIPSKSIARCLIEELGNMVTPEAIDVIDGTLVVSACTYYWPHPLTPSLALSTPIRSHHLFLSPPPTDVDRDCRLSLLPRPHDPIPPPSDGHDRAQSTGRVVHFDRGQQAALLEVERREE